MKMPNGPERTRSSRAMRSSSVVTRVSPSRSKTLKASNLLCLWTSRHPPHFSPLCKLNFCFWHKAEVFGNAAIPPGFLGTGTVLELLAGYVGHGKGPCHRAVKTDLAACVGRRA